MTTKRKTRLANWAAKDDLAEFGIPVGLYPFMIGILLTGAAILFLVGEKIVAGGNVDGTAAATVVGLGLLFLYCGLRTLHYIVKMNSLKPLAKSGPHVHEVTGTLVKVRRNHFLLFYGRNSESLVVEYEDQRGQRHQALSEPVWYNTDTWNRELPVRLNIDRDNPARAWVRAKEFLLASKAQRFGPP